MNRFLLSLIVSGVFTACNEASPEQKTTAADTVPQTKKNVITCPPGSKLDIVKIEQITGMKGVEKEW